MWNILFGVFLTIVGLVLSLMALGTVAPLLH